jgi:hypothetical protein
MAMVVLLHSSYCVVAMCYAIAHPALGLAFVLGAFPGEVRSENESVQEVKAFIEL